MQKINQMFKTRNRRYILTILNLISMIDTWNNPPEEKENECAYCGDPCDGRYCSNDCRKGYEADN